MEKDLEYDPAARAKAKFARAREKFIEKHPEEWERAFGPGSLNKQLAGKRVFVERPRFHHPDADEMERRTYRC